jgi:uncharacterized membrane protein YhiD involved in acid resistance
MHQKRVLITALLTVAIGMGLPAIAAAAQPDVAAHLASSEEVTSHLIKLRDAAIALPLSTLLGTALALRPRRKGTPPRSSAVVQTQIILALIGALVMLVVGASLARAFGVVGAAGLIRYRAKIDDPKDAGVMLSTLGVGLASGVGLYPLAVFAAIFIVGVLWALESFEPEPYKRFTLKVTSKDITHLQPQLERFLRRQHVEYDLRTSSPEEVCYDVHLPMQLKTDRVSNAIQRLSDGGGATVEWDEKKKRDQV